MLKLKKDYVDLLPSHIDNERAIEFVRDTFTNSLFKYKWGLTRTSAPLFIESGKCINDDLANTATPVSFNICRDIGVEMVHSLAKWKRLKVKELGMCRFQGIYTNMNAIRKDEILDNLHSVYVDQWDWEMVIKDIDRSVATLKSAVIDIYYCIKETENKLCREKFQHIKPFLPDSVKFFTLSELKDKYPNESQTNIERIVTKEYGAVFIIGMGKECGRASDYDDWNLNGDLLIWSNVIDAPIEITSMGIRVDKTALKQQLLASNEQYKEEFDYHKMILNDELPLTIGGGIGQSRLCMLLLQKAHIGEVQCSVWDKETLDYAKENKIRLLN